MLSELYSQHRLILPNFDHVTLLSVSLHDFPVHAMSRTYTLGWPSRPSLLSQNWLPNMPGMPQSWASQPSSTIQTSPDLVVDDKARCIAAHNATFCSSFKIHREYGTVQTWTTYSSPSTLASALSPSLFCLSNLRLLALWSKNLSYFMSSVKIQAGTQMVLYKYRITSTTDLRKEWKKKKPKRVVQKQAIWLKLKVVQSLKSLTCPRFHLYIPC